MQEKLQNEQELRQERYKRVIERESNPETRETIDIYRTPLLFRADVSVISNLDYERRGAIISSSRAGYSQKNYTSPSMRDKTKSEGGVIYLELPSIERPTHIPPEEDLVGRLLKGELDDYLDNLAKDISSLEEVFLRFYNGSGTETYYQLQKNYPEYGLDPSVSIRNLVRFIGYMRALGHIDHFNTVKFEELNNQEKSYLLEKEREFLDELRTNQDFIKIWLWGQKMVLAGGYVVQSSVSNYGGFIIRYSDLDSKDLTLATNQTHGDFNLEILSTTNIKADKIIGYLEYRRADSETKLIDCLDKDLRRLEQTSSLPSSDILRELFPFLTETEDLKNNFREGIIKYIVDRFNVDPAQITKKEFIELLVKKMGIPIYNLKGDQLWPDQKTHEEIEKITNSVKS